MSLDFKRAFTYLKENENWLFTFTIIAILTLITNVSVIAVHNVIAVMPITLFMGGFHILLINNLIHEKSPILQNFKSNISNLFMTGLKYWGVSFGFIGLFAILALGILMIHILIIFITSLLGIAFISKESFSSVMNAEVIIFTIVIVSFALYYSVVSLFMSLTFGEHLSFKKAFCIKKITGIIARDWVNYLLLFVLSALVYISFPLIREVSYIYDNKVLLYIVLILQSIVMTYFFFALTFLFTQAYKQSLAKLENSEEKVELLQHNLNNIDYKIISSIVVISIAFLIALCLLPISPNSSIGRLNTQLTQISKMKAKQNHSSSYSPTYKK